MNKALLDKPAAWLSGDGPDATFVIGCRGSLARNLADIPYPARCTGDERRSVEERVLQALETTNLLEEGRYWSSSSLEPRELRFLRERYFLPQDSVCPGDGCGVYISNDQTRAITVNAQDHLRMVTMTSGLQPCEIWPCLNTLDDALGSVLDFAFDETLGYQTAAFDEMGTGFRITVFLHLPGLTLLNRQIGLEQQMRERHHTLIGAFGPVGEGRGDLYALSNRATLGLSEEELAYHGQHAASDLIAAEKEARQTILREGLRGLEDRVGRAQGVARGARLLAFDEAVAVLSSLRLGVSEGILTEYGWACLNDLLLTSQQGHIEAKMGRDCDELTLNVERADLFRARLS